MDMCACAVDLVTELSIPPKPVQQPLFHILILRLKNSSWIIFNSLSRLSALYCYFWKGNFILKKKLSRTRAFEGEKEETEKQSWNPNSSWDVAPLKTKHTLLHVNESEHSVQLTPERRINSELRAAHPAFPGTFLHWSSGLSCMVASSLLVYRPSHPNTAHSYLFAVKIFLTEFSLNVWKPAPFSSSLCSCFFFFFLVTGCCPLSFKKIFEAYKSWTQNLFSFLELAVARARWVISHVRECACSRQLALQHTES